MTNQVPASEVPPAPSIGQPEIERRQFAPLATRRGVLRDSILVCDVITLIVSFLVSYWIAHRLSRGPVWPLNSYLWILWVILPSWVLMLRWVDLYASASFSSAKSIFKRLLKAHIVSSLLTLSILYVTKSSQVSRIMMQSFIASSFVMLLFQKLLLMAIIERWRSKVARQQTKLLIIATPHLAQHYADLIAHHASLAADVIGLVVPDAHSTPLVASDQAIRILGRLGDFAEILQNNVIDEVLLLSPIQPTELVQLIDRCSQRGLAVRMMVEVPSAESGTWQMDKWNANTFFLSLSAVPRDPLQVAAKRLVDIAGSLVGLVLFAVTWALYWRRIKRESGGTVIFSQRRVGMNGRGFLMHKFRTMYHDAEQREAGLRALNQMRGPMFKLKDDPRVTPIGLMLRRRHLDELPQFWNVLRGEMSLVGTRPPTESEVIQYRDWHHRRLSIRPGLTGLWQLNGNHRVNDFEEVVKLDCEYIDSWSLWLDLRIIAGTISKILRGEGW